jgi:hypothetical protein
VIDHRNPADALRKNGWINPVVERAVKGEPLLDVTESEVINAFCQLAFHINLSTGRNVEMGAPKGVAECLTIIHDAEALYTQKVLRDET